MRKVILYSSLLLLALSMPLMAQDNPRAGIFGGYQFLHLNADGISENANGWDAAVTGNLNSYFGVTGDFSGSYKSISGASGHVYTYTFGPTATIIPEGKVNPFVHALFGGTSVGGSLANSGSASTSGFAMFIGGGVDAKVNKNISVRAVQFDWLHYSVSGVSGSSNVRLCFGVVLHF
jgi:hypothetical protein